MVKSNQETQTTDKYRQIQKETGMKEYHDIKSVAKELRVHPETLRRAIRGKRLAASRIGRGYRVTEQAVEAYLESQKVEVK